LTRNSVDGPLVDIGYSGKAEGKNKPDMQHVPGTGPLPRGKYRIGPPFHHGHAGPYSMRLTPHPGTQTFGRSGFLIHADSIASPGNASGGCIVLPLTARKQIWNSGDHELEVMK
jgi:hypothetical protein